MTNEEHRNDMLHLVRLMTDPERPYSERSAAEIQLRIEITAYIWDHLRTLMEGYHG